MAVVTGGGTGIGRATARALAADGMRVLVVGRTPDTLAGTAAGHGDVRTLVADLTDDGVPERITAAALEAFGRLDVLVHNAAAVLPEPVGAVTREHARTQVETNLLAPVMLTRAALPALAAARGTVVAVGTAAVQGRRAFAGLSLYGATKTALDFLVRTWAVELAPLGVRAVGVAPGETDTCIGERMGWSPADIARHQAEAAARTPSGRVGRPEDVAWWITRLTRPEAVYASGTVVAVDGGASVA
ncbi:SDR family oxidoreductase [Streptomyces sp. AC602_WCS936]|uniref:SDR family NAD(P)-dependent oxidoreductase n=1 Tax=Streptomyces sp. AC602_WCS936 TaxID=2823685 RepID=UPI0027E50FD6|nr:SDR family oxidoreductase [Streptomyces sp. AC602_WCS936]